MEEIELIAEQITENTRIVDQFVAGLLILSKGAFESVTNIYLDVVALHQQTYKGKLLLANIIIFRLMSYRG
ncbi:hypothetical protein D3C74_271930 [compost metagenome]